MTWLKLRKEPLEPFEMMIFITSMSIMMVSLFEIMEFDGGWGWLLLIYLAMALVGIDDYWRIKREPERFTRRTLWLSSVITLILLIIFTIVLVWEVMN